MPESPPARRSPIGSLLLVVAVAALASWGWRGWLGARDGEAMAQLARPGDIRMISSETCGWCTLARRYFEAEGVPFSECFVERDAQCAADYQALGAQGTPTLIVKGRAVLGFDRGRILDLLK